MTLIPRRRGTRGWREHTRCSPRSALRSRASCSRFSSSMKKSIFRTFFSPRGTTGIGAAAGAGSLDGGAGSSVCTGYLIWTSREADQQDTGCPVFSIVAHSALKWIAEHHLLQGHMICFLWRRDVARLQNLGTASAKGLARQAHHWRQCKKLGSLVCQRLLVRHTLTMVSFA